MGLSKASGWQRSVSPAVIHGADTAMIQFLKKTTHTGGKYDVGVE
jgi:hypothetical protein